MTSSSRFPTFTAPWTSYENKAKSRDITGLSVVKTLR
jgi:hypothetical protein